MSSKFYRNLAIIIAVLGFVGGIIAGFIFKIPDPDFSWRDPSFNYILIIIFWCSAAFWDTIYIGIYKVMHNQELIYKKLNDLLKTDKVEEQKTNYLDNFIKDINI